MKTTLALETGRIPRGKADRLVAARLASLREQMLKLRQPERVLQKVQGVCAGHRPYDACLVDPAMIRGLKNGGHCKTRVSPE